MVFQNRRHGEKLLMIVASMLSFSTGNDLWSFVIFFLTGLKLRLDKNG